MTTDKAKNVENVSEAVETMTGDTQSKNQKQIVTQRHRAAPPALFETVEAASAKLSLDPTALRARLRRAQRVEGDRIVADLGGGIHGFKFGKSWRIRFPEA
jgi:hypothetical protein